MQVRVWDISGLRKKTVSPGGEDVLRIPPVGTLPSSIRLLLSRAGRPSLCRQKLSPNLRKAAAQHREAMHLPWLVTSSNDVNIVMTKALYEDSF